MRGLKSDAIAFLAGVAFALATGTGCGPRYQYQNTDYIDTLNPDYPRFAVQRIALVVWCSHYVADDPDWLQMDPLSPSKTPLERADDWDKALTPAVIPLVESSLSGLGYEAVDVTSSVKFGSGGQTSDVLNMLRNSNPDINAVLLFTYVVSPFHTGASASNEPMGAVATNNQVTASMSGSYGNRNYRTYYNNTAYIQWNSGYFNSINGLNLRGALKLVDVQTGQTLWEIGEHSVYAVHSSDFTSASKSEAFDRTLREFSSQFTRSASNRHGLPPKPTG
jgi:hypothetical protein